MGSLLVKYWIFPFDTLFANELGTRLVFYFK